MLFQEKVVLNREQSKHRKTRLFLDLETTGLSWRTSHIYMIGLLEDRGETEALLSQWFLADPAGEAELLRDFCAHLQQYDPASAPQLFHYNGDTFDLPYLRNKCAFFGLEDPISSIPGTDLYRSLRPCQGILGLTTMRQRDLEERLGISRRDEKTGAELITVYQEYLASGDPQLLALLRLHNRDDICNLPALAEALCIPAFFQGDFSLSAIRETEDTVCFALRPADAITSTLLQGISRGALTVQPDPVLSVRKYRGTLKLFFPDYREYYYLPEEDTAIHKSVGAYVDPAHREKATARTCYQKHTAVFLPQSAEFFQPAFREERSDRRSYFLLPGTWNMQDPALHAYLAALLREQLKPVTSRGCSPGSP